MPYANIEDERAFRKRQRATTQWKQYHAKYNAEWSRANREKYRQYSAAWRAAHPQRYLLLIAKARAKKRGISFELEECDIVVPDICPVLGIPLFFKEKTHKKDVTPNSPSLDRIRPELGYVKGNVQVISWRANNIKRDATPEELRKVADYVNRQDL
jgi:hypothetical protein